MGDKVKPWLMSISTLKKMNQTQPCLKLGEWVDD